MNLKLRKYGTSPYNIAVIHGGPGAPGTVAELAAGLSDMTGVLEPFQTSMSIEGQIRELRDTLKEHGELPVTLAGHSWGAWLAFMFAARYPSYVKKLILIASGPFKESYASLIMQKRLERLNNNEIREYLKLSASMADPDVKNKDYFFTRYGKLISNADSFDLVHSGETGPGLRYDVNRIIWKEASYLRKSGKLLDMGRMIRCPVVAIHGNYDPHPFEGVKEPLSRVIDDFRYVLLDKCGHYPWLEKHSAEAFYHVMAEEIAV
ncbi:alpha/beta fold hydrolase [Methanolobus sp. WCC5]|jgi:pimeloyl-ACP methyl ester carboxylesterase|uniref:alpha/beta fold hydrolase n=1 Tax=Methanolobus sp. WCC5 TaxID=3125785 RepID=UPI003246ED06